MMEALWGPRSGGPAGPVTRPTGDLDTGQAHEARRDASDDTADLRQMLDALRADVAAVEVRLDQRVAGLVARHDEGLASVRADLAELQASVTAAGANRSVREADVSAELELIERWERESAAQLADLEKSVGSELKQLSLGVAAALGAVEGGVVTPAQQSQLHADIESQMVEQLRLVLQEALEQVDARATVIEAEMNGRLEASVTMDAFVALRSELKEALSSNMASAQAVLQQRAALLEAAVADVKSQVAGRLDGMAAMVATEAAAAAERAALAALERRFPAS
jgi:hypothetical protein